MNERRARLAGENYHREICSAGAGETIHWYKFFGHSNLLNALFYSMTLVNFSEKKFLTRCIRCNIYLVIWVCKLGADRKTHKRSTEVILIIYSHLMMIQMLPI